MPSVKVTKEEARWIALNMAGVADGAVKNGMTTVAQQCLDISERFSKAAKGGK